MADNWVINQTVDLQKGIENVYVWPSALMYVGDKNAHTWNVTILDGGKPASITGGVNGYFIRQDGTTVYVQGKLSGNVASVTLDDDCYAFEGDLRALMRISTSDKIITISALLFQVRYGITDQIVDPSGVIPSLDELLAQIEVIKSATSAANTATSKANTAASNADTATKSANTATSNANAATSSANAAAKSANDAAARANAAADGHYILYDTTGQNTNGPMTQKAVTDAIGVYRLGPGGVPYGKELTESWSELQTKIRAGNFAGISIGDYKTIQLTTDETVIMEVAGIDQYYKCGDTSIGHHIDFISRDALKDTRVMNSTTNNNGNEAEPNPWRASELFTVMNNTVFKTLPTDLQSCIIEKRAYIPSRYSSAGKLNNDGGGMWGDMGKLWLPTEIEVFGFAHWSTVGYGTYGGGCNVQYPIFMGGTKHIIKGAGNGGVRCAWGEASARRDSSTSFCGADSRGVASGDVASNASVRFPLCFRIG